MKKEEVKNAIYYIFERAYNKDIPLGKVRLIKLLYLLDVENYRSRQNIYSGLEWIFYKFGPYSFEIEDLFDEIGVTEEVIPISEGRFFKKLNLEIEDIEIELDVETKAIIEKLIDEWSTAHLYELLDYVYFQTEPMYDVKYKKKLDFSNIKRIKPEKPIRLSPKTKEKLKILGKKIKEHINKIEIPEDLHVKSPPDTIKDASFWEEEIMDLIQLKGKVKIIK